MELWDLYTEDRRPAGRDHVRGEPLPPGCYHLVVHVWIRSPGGKYLISQRAADRPTHPLLWECVGGSVLKGEDSLSAALREVKEEVGVELDPRRGGLVFSKTRKVEEGIRCSDILDAYLFEYGGPIALEKASTREVAQAAWLTAEQVRELYRAGLLVPTLGYFFTEIAK